MLLKKPKNTVLIYEFEATDGSGYELSDRLPGLLLDYMQNNPDINALPISEMNDISKQTAVEYATGCPSNEYAGVLTFSPSDRRAFCYHGFGRRFARGCTRYSHYSRHIRQVKRR